MYNPQNLPPMKTTYQIVVILLAIFLGTISTEAQILKKLKKGVQQATEEVLVEKAAKEIAEETEKLLDTMDGYAEKLNDPKVSLKEIYPLVQAMETEKERIIPIVRNLPDTDGLKAILEEVLMTSSKEIIKFSRGDYNDP